MKKTLLSIAAVLSLSVGSAQTQLFFEDFEGGAGGFTLNTADLGGVVGTAGDNFWVVNNAYAGGTITTSICFPGNTVNIGATPAQPAGISSANGNYLHILSKEADNDGSVLNANYALADGGFCFFAASHFAHMTTDINTTNFTNVTFDFWWLGVASSFAQGELYYSTDGGTTWTQKTGTPYYGQNGWVQETLTDPAWDGQATLRFGFRFNNQVDGGFAGTDPAFSVDDIEITGIMGSPCSDTYSSITETACFSYTVPSGDETYTMIGTQTVMDTIMNSGGCDSIMTIMVTINDVDTSVTSAPDYATANATGATFQWLDCDNAMTMVSGGTNSTITGNGNFAVEVTQNGCVDTSACYNVQTGSINEFESIEFNVYPNPTEGGFSIDLSGLTGSHILHIVDAKGSIITVENVEAGQTLSYELQLESGVYIIELIDQHGMIRRSRLMVE